MHLLHKLDQRTNLPLSPFAAMRVGNEMSRREKQRSSWPIDHSPQGNVRLPDFGWNGKRSVCHRGKGPAGEHSHTLADSALCAVGREGIRHPQPLRKQRGLVTIALNPRYSGGRVAVRGIMSFEGELRERSRSMPKRKAPKPQPPGTIIVTSPPGTIEVLPGYKGPRTAKDLPFALPPRIWNPGRKGGARGKAAAPAALTQIDGRSYTVDQKWSGLRFIFKVDHLGVKQGETTFNLFTTHIGRTVGGVAHWTEVGIIRAAQDTRYRLFTFDSEVEPDDRWDFFGTMNEGEVFELVIRLNEADAGPYRYETFCSGKRVRKGTLPRLDCQVDVSHESWSDTGTFTTGDHVIAVEGWVNYPPNKARWYASDLNVASYTTNSTVKNVNLAKPAALKFESYT